MESVLNMPVFTNPPGNPCCFRESFRYAGDHLHDLTLCVFPALSFSGTRNLEHVRGVRKIYAFGDR